MKISEIFYSIQGEGSLVGVPSVFIRTSGCNLRCVWCDTPDTSWSPKGEDRSIEQIIAEVEPFCASHVVVTGGEPMIAQEIAALTSRLCEMGLHITIETAGTVYHPVSCDLMSISPKLRNSIPYDRDEGRWAAQHDRLRYQPEVLKRLASEYNHQLKFVVASREDLDEIEELQAELHIESRNIILMPEGTDPAVLYKRAQWIVDICKRKQYRFSPRVHIDLWGAQRGV
ncbi:MAG: 7-carboxy-7-deazaguanine synthase QueE [Bryobacteraceae bacterium]